MIGVEAMSGEDGTKPKVDVVRSAINLGTRYKAAKTPEKKVDLTMAGALLALLVAEPENTRADQLLTLIRTIDPHAAAG